MIRLLQFDTYATRDEVSAEVRAMLRNVPGVQGIEVLEALEGAPHYAVLLEIDDAQAESVAKRLDALIDLYRGDAWNHSNRAFRKIG